MMRSSTTVRVHAWVRGFSHVKAWSRVLRSEGVTPKQKDVDKAEASARAAFGACVTAINAVDSLSYRFAEVRREGVRCVCRCSVRLQQCLARRMNVTRFSFELRSSNLDISVVLCTMLQP